MSASIEQHLITLIQIGDMFYLQLHVVLALDTGKMHLRYACDQFRPERIVAASGVAVSKQ